METINIWKVTPGSQVGKAEVVEPVGETDTERLLEDVLTISPELLLPDLSLVGRQVETPGGPLDLLGVDEDGRLVVFELKRGSLTRDAVAQAIDYTSYLAGLELGELGRLIGQSSGRGGIEKIEDFAQWYQSQYPDQPLAEIGVPRIVLVGLGVDERAKRMVQFLAQSELDISLITFHGFKLGNETLLARQVEVRRPAAGIRGATKAENQAHLEKVLAELGIRQTYDSLASIAKGVFGDSAYQWPNPTGYSFYLREVTASGGPTNKAYLSLYAPQDRNGKIQLLLHPRAMEGVERDKLNDAAKAMGSNLLPKANGSGEIWIDGHRSASHYAQPLTDVAQLIAAGWRAKMDSRGSPKAEQEIPQPV
jgi:hypothetical protein